MIEAHVFQHQYSGLQLFVYHCQNVEQASRKLRESNCLGNYKDWLYIGKKLITK